MIKLWGIFCKLVIIGVFEIFSLSVVVSGDVDDWKVFVFINLESIMGWFVWFGIFIFIVFLLGIGVLICIFFVVKFNLILFVKLVILLILMFFLGCILNLVIVGFCVWLIILVCMLKFFKVLFSIFCCICSYELFFCLEIGGWSKLNDGNL